MNHDKICRKSTFHYIFFKLLVKINMRYPMAHTRKKFYNKQFFAIQTLTNKKRGKNQCFEKPRTIKEKNSSTFFWQNSLLR